ncbi:hypothetical protein C8J57DRAFT_1505350 [Mycena rebaudengoi]|nr:hypothetical protein C8J57DRAFT_1505350 [Mycena rebaudengoi]
MPSPRPDFETDLSRVKVCSLWPLARDATASRTNVTTSRVDLSMLLHPHPYTSNLIPCPSTTDDDTLLLTLSRDVPTPLPAADNTIFAATTMTPALRRSSTTPARRQVQRDVSTGLYTLSESGRPYRGSYSRARERVAPEREPGTAPLQGRVKSKLDRDANAPRDEREAGDNTRKGGNNHNPNHHTRPPKIAGWFNMVHST